MNSIHCDEEIEENNSKSEVVSIEKETGIESQENTEDAVKNSPKKNTRKTKQVERKIYTCSLLGCEKSFSRLWKLEAHNRMHTGERPFKCEFPKCGKGYTNISHLRRHEKVSHSSEPINATTFPCTYSGCVKILKTKQNLQKHIDRFHTRTRLKCTRCHELFWTQSQLDEHNSEHVESPPFKCEQCGTGFMCLNLYNRHIRCHKIHICPFSDCTEAYADYKLLRVHMATGHPPDYYCHYCGKGLRRKEALVNHIDRHMKIISGLIPKRKPPPKLSFQCTLCPQVLTKKASLQRHVRVMHEMDPRLKEIRRLSKAMLPKVKKERKDKFIKKGPKQSIASVLSNVQLPDEFNRRLLNNQTGEASDLPSFLLNKLIEEVNASSEIPLMDADDSKSSTDFDSKDGLADSYTSDEDLKYSHAIENISQSEIPDGLVLPRTNEKVDVPKD